MLEKTLENPLDCKGINPVNPKGNQSWIFIGRTDAEAETPILWPSDAKSWLIGKDPDAGKDWRQEEKGTLANVMVGWHHRLSGHELVWTLGVGDGQGSLGCCSPCDLKELATTGWLNNNNKQSISVSHPSSRSNLTTPEGYQNSRRFTCLEPEAFEFATFDLSYSGKIINTCCREALNK